MNIKYFDKTGKEVVKGFSVNKSVFGARVNKALLEQYVFSYNSNKRQANAQTRDRGEVSGGGKKPWKQKGTGRARAGSSRSPIWRGGGVTFGPSNNRNYKKGLTKKMTKEAFRSAFSLAAKNSSVIALQDIELDKPNAKEIMKLLKSLNLSNKTIIVSAKTNNNMVMSIRNIETLSSKNINELNPYDILNAKTICILEEAFEYINNKWQTKPIRIRTKKIIKKKLKTK